MYTSINQKTSNSYNDTLHIFENKNHRVIYSFYFTFVMKLYLHSVNIHTKIRNRLQRSIYSGSSL